MESMPLSGQHAARAMKIRGFANLESVRRNGDFAQAASRHFPAAEPLERSLSGTFHLLLKKQDKIRGVGAPPPTEKARAHRWQFAQTNKNFP